METYLKMMASLDYIRLGKSGYMQYTELWVGPNIVPSVYRPSVTFRPPVHSRVIRNTFWCELKSDQEPL